MANKIADARRSLIRAKESAAQRMVEIDKERRDIRASIKSLDAALKALEGSRKTRDRQKPPVENAIQEATDFGPDTTE